MFTRVNKIKRLEINQFKGLTVGQTCIKLEELEIQPDDFIYRQDTIICLSGYDENNTYIEYQIDFSDNICNWSEFV